MGRKIVNRKFALEIIPSRVLTDEVEEIKDSSEDVERARIRKRVGLDYETLCKTVRDGIVAELYDEVTGTPLRGKPAHATRAKFIAAAVEILGAKKAEGAAQKCPTIVIIRADGSVWNPRQR